MNDQNTLKEQKSEQNAEEEETVGSVPYDDLIRELRY